MRMIRVYISAPYSIGHQGTNTRKALEVANHLFDLGYAPYVPHLTHFWHFLFPRTWEDWLKLDLTYVEICDIVLRLKGESKGADTEVAHAKELGIPVVYSVEDLLIETRKIQKEILRIGDFEE